MESFDKLLLATIALYFEQLITAMVITSVRMFKIIHYPDNCLVESMIFFKQKQSIQPYFLYKCSIVKEGRRSSNLFINGQIAMETSFVCLEAAAAKKASK